MDFLFIYPHICYFIASDTFKCFSSYFFIFGQMQSCKYILIDIVLVHLCTVFKGKKQWFYWNYDDDKFILKTDEMSKGPELGDELKGPSGLGNGKEVG